jgi:CubicO group peptidase (beta-lactamase class C family)
VLCALIIENVSGIPYHEYMKKYVFEPLGVKTAVIDNELLNIENRVQGYGLKDGEAVAVDKSHDWLLGAGDMVGTVDDVYALNGAVKNKLLLKEKTWREVLTPSPHNNMGMGCTVTNWHGKTRVNHNGGHAGFRTLHIHLLEDDFDVIFLSNSGYGCAREDLAEVIHDIFFGADNEEVHKIEMDKGYAVT